MSKLGTRVNLKKITLPNTILFVFITTKFSLTNCGTALPKNLIYRRQFTHTLEICASDFEVKCQGFCFARHIFDKS